jgi:hypothetical protein
VLDGALGFEASEHGADCRGARRVGEAGADVLGRRLAQPEQDIHDFPLAAGQLLRRSRHRLSCYFCSYVLQP